MGQAQQIDAAFERIEGMILPTLSTMLDTLFDASGLARPGLDAEVHAAEIRTIALQLESLTRDIEDVARTPVRTIDYRTAGRA